MKRSSLLKRHGSDKLRSGLAGGIETVAIGLLGLAERIRLVYTGPLCPDCNLAPDPGPDGECPMCRDKYDYQSAMAEQRIEVW